MGKRVRRFSNVLLLCLLTVFAANYAQAAPNLINYQGFLKDNGGNPVTHSNLPMEFAIYDADGNPIVGNMLWGETQTVTVTNGKYNVLLGSGTQILGPLDPSLFSSSDRWLQVKVNNETQSPRQKLTSVPFALEASSVSDGSITDASITGPINATKIGSSGLNADLLDGQHANDLIAAASAASSWLEGSDQVTTDVNVGIGT